MSSTVAPSIPPSPQPATQAPPRPSPAPDRYGRTRRLLLTGLLLLAGCSDPPADEPAESGLAPATPPPAATTPDNPPGLPAAAGGPPNILLISIDTLRADHLGCYGHPANATPNIDKLAAAGRRFATCVASSPITLPSHATMLTGSYPFVHGARSNIRFRLTPENETLPELLRDRGYTTMAEVAATVLNRESGLAQGFGSYRDPGGEAGTSLERTADEITTAAGLFLARRHDKPFFAFVHYFDPHAPYEPPAPFAEKFDDPYVGEIAFVDQQIGRLLAILTASPYARNTVVILTADHGEGRGEHGEASHSFYLYDTTQRVPLIMWGAGRVPPGVEDRPARLVDLAPTIATLTGLERTSQMQGIDLLAAAGPPGPAYAETLEPQLAFEFAALRALWHDGWKYIHAPNPLLYHVAVDPDERENLAEREPERVDSLRAMLRRTLDDAPAVTDPSDAVRNVDQKRLDEMAALGYVGDSESEVDSSELDRFDPTGPDPHVEQQTLQRFANAVGHLMAEDFAAAIPRLEQMLEDERDNAVLLRYYARALRGAGRGEDALAAFDRLIAAQPGTTSGRLERARLLRSLGRLEETEATLRQVIELAPQMTAAYVELARLLDASQRPDQAGEVLAAGRAALGENYQIELATARHLAATRRPGEAVQLIQGLIRRKPNRFDAHGLLADLLLAQGRADQAVKMLVSFQQQHPGESQVVDPLAQALLAAGQADKAAELLKSALQAFPPTGRRHLQLAVAQRRAGNADEALASFRKAVELAPRMPAAWLGIAQISERRGDLEAARAAYERLRETAPRNPQGYLGQASLALGRGDLEAAEEALRAGVARLPRAPRLLESLTWLLATCADDSIRNCAEAGQLADRLGEFPPTLSLIDTRAAAYACGGNFERAAALLDEALAGAGEAPKPFRAAISARRALYGSGQPYVERLSAD